MKMSLFCRIMLMYYCLIGICYSYFFQSDNAYNQTSDSSNPNYRKVFTYFKKYQKLKEAVKHLTGLIEETKHTITYLESVETALSHASISDIEDIREELVETGFVKCRTRDKHHNRKKPEQYLASDGKTIIMVGRNNLQNYELTFKMAKMS